jgi:hypothetical protein
VVSGHTAVSAARGSLQKGLRLLQNDRSSRSADQSANDINSTRGAVSLIVGSVWVDCLDNDFSA